MSSRALLGPESELMALFFDLDGCLVDSTEAIPRAMNEALDALGLPRRSPSSLRRFIGPPLLESFVVLLGELGADPASGADAVEAYRESYAEISPSATRLVPGIEAALDRLEGWPMAVVTSKPAVFATPILEALGLARRFEGVFAPSLEAMSEPKAAALGRAMIALDAARGQSIMVGDRLHDMLAGRECGTRTIGVTWGAGTRHELLKAGADRVVDAPSELLGAIDLERGP